MKPTIDQLSEYYLLEAEKPPKDYEDKVRDAKGHKDIGDAAKHYWPQKRVRHDWEDIKKKIQDRGASSYVLASFRNRGIDVKSLDDIPVDKRALALTYAGHAIIHGHTEKSK